LKKVGLHIRIENQINEAIEKALEYKLPTFQCFLVNSYGKYINPTQEEINSFVKKRDSFDKLFIHSSFWINLANSKSYNLRLMKKELELAKKLKFTHVVIHPGSAKEYETKEPGINLLAKRLNKILKDEKEITILLENTAHGKKTIGNDFQDLKKIQEKVDYQLKFCLDTAHAYAFGYDLKKDLDNFLKMVDETIGIKNIELLHLNESAEALGSEKDKHTVPGQGKIGIPALTKILKHPKLKNVPAIIELPPKTSLAQEEKSISLF
jgi:deoxyribonuclease IV